MLHYAVIGSPIAQSRSPEIYRKLYDERGINADFSKIEIIKEQIPHVRELMMSYNGFAVTMPHKQTIISYVDQLDKTAIECHAVNIVKSDRGIWTGYNTDCIGVIDAINQNNFDVCGKSAAIYGRGGAARAAAYALESRGAAVTFYVRSITNCGNRHEKLFISREITPCDIFINATPLGMKDELEFENYKFLIKMKPSIVFDMVYKSDTDTELIERSKEYGITTISGNELLYRQALAAMKIWFADT